MHRIFLFPGQGSQYVGMGKDLYDGFNVARDVFQEVDDALDQNLSKIIFGDDLDLLTMTENAQPALMTVSMAFLRVLLHGSAKKIEDLCAFVAGHSLGEYTALCAAGSISLRDTARLLKLRGTSMQSACKPNEGGMTACLGVSAFNVEQMLLEANKSGICQIANDNSLEQVVVSGQIAALEALEDIMKSASKKAIRLKVSAPFHSSLIAPAAEIMRDALMNTNISKPSVPVIANVIARDVCDPQMIVDLLVQQVTGRVRWRETMDFIAGNEITEVVEIGPGKVLTTLAKRSAHEFAVHNIGNCAELEGFKY